MNVVSGRNLPATGCLLSRYPHAPEGGVMADLAFIGLTIAAFAVLFLLVKAVERF
jgi:hypothetical protein